MTDRRTLLKVLLLLGPVTVLVSACRHHRPNEPREEPERRGDGY